MQFKIYQAASVTTSFLKKRALPTYLSIVKLISVIDFKRENINVTFSQSITRRYSGSPGSR
jgi:hypothetical protein